MEQTEKIFPKCDDLTKPIPVGTILSLPFFIPSYQRGYRWEEQQIKDLLKDLDEFDIKDKIYCIQPIVVKWNKDEKKWNLVDGQQRITSIALLIRYFNSFVNNPRNPDPVPKIYYETRPKSSDFLNTIDVDDKNGLVINTEYSINSNIDFKYMARVYQAIFECFNEKKEKNPLFSESEIKDKLYKNTHIVWYELPEDEKEIDSFTRLNIGKIPLTSAELIKALLLNKSNFSTGNIEEDKLISTIQIQIANEWDRIENTLRDNKFWLFIHEKEYKKPNRIDFLFDLIQKNDLFKLIPDPKELGKDKLKSFRYISMVFDKAKEEKSHKSYLIRRNWEKIKSYFRILEEWYSNIEYFHYVGYLVAIKGSGIVSVLLSEWNNKETKEDFKKYLIMEIKRCLGKSRNLNQEYESKGNPKKTDARPLLLLHNVITVVKQNELCIKNDKYKSSIYYKFPFHLYKNENWDVEHIDSNTGNTLENLADKKEWIMSAFEELPEPEKPALQDKVKAFLNQKDDDNGNFASLNNEIFAKLKLVDSLDDHQKNQIGNYALLDSGTNRGYGNSIFSTKRQWIIGKEEGVKYTLIMDSSSPKGYVVGKEDAKSAFVPPCTKKAFMKGFSGRVDNLHSWDLQNANDYKENIKTVLQEFLSDEVN